MVTTRRSGIRTPAVLAKARAVRLLLTDVDGVLTDGQVYYSDSGEELVRFSRRDGMGVERLRAAGIETGIVTREQSPIVARRAEKLGVTELHLGVEDKLQAIEAIAAGRGLELSEVAYVGDDMNDLAALRAVGLSACPADAEPLVRDGVNYVTLARGGGGAFRELAELVLAARHRCVEGDGVERSASPVVRIAPPPRRRWLPVGARAIGDGEPTYVIAEIGINHNGSVEIAKKLIDGAVAAGCDCVKFQKRTPELCVPADQQHLERDTPWGRITYLEYRRKVELNFAQYADIARYCRDRGIAWTASCWDEPSVDFLAAFDPPFLKAPSAALTDHELLRAMQATGRPVLLSTGMSTLEQIDAAVEALGAEQLLLAHATSTYPCPPRELNLRMLLTLRDRYEGVPVGYSGHETGLATTYAAVALGAAFLERHITLDRSMWGSDQAASVEVVGLMRLVRDVRAIEESLGDGVKRVYQSELGALKRLRRTSAPALAEVAAPA
jgi:YrbI family 3-deoxy-D-manno-octulosonate 8-phosphate phosphatase